MLVAAIIGLLATIAGSKVSNLIRKAKEAALKGNLGAVRGAFRIFRVDHDDLIPLMSGGCSNCCTPALGGAVLDSTLVPNY